MPRNSTKNSAAQPEKKPAAKSSKKQETAPKKASSAKKQEAAPKKTAVKKVGKSKPAHAAKREESSKTPQVMRLVEPIKGKNPVIAAGKSRIPGVLRGREPLSRLMKRGLQGSEYLVADDSEVVNLTELVVKYEAPQILDRFNACSCERCVESFSKIILTKVPARFARISKSNIGIRSRELYGRVEPVRKIVYTAMIKELIGSKKRLFHDENGQFDE